MTDSQQLLTEYARNGSDAVFRELVAQHVNLVYAVALRLVGGDTHRAQDVAQTVFLDLSRAARTIPPQAVLAGWLHRRTCFVAANLMRGERRRQSRERQAVEMNRLHQPSEPDFSAVAPELDEAINELDDDDRTAILLRFFEQRDFRSVGAALGSNEDAARMRVTRALEKLETLLKRRGVTTTAAALSTVLFANAAPAAPIGLAATISTATALTGTTITAATTTATKAIAMTTLQKTFISVTVAALAGTGIYEARQASRLRDENRNLTAKQEALSNERDAALSAMTAGKDELDRLQKNQLELLRLRGEVGALRQQTNDLERLRKYNQQLQSALAKAAQNKTETDPEDTPERREAIAKMNNSRQLVLALLMYADDNGGKFPNGFNHTAPYLGNTPEHQEATNQFELVIHGSLKGITNSSTLIAVREKQATMVKGKWTKIYGFADGHSELKTEPPEGFEAWEKAHTVPQPVQ